MLRSAELVEQFGRNELLPTSKIPVTGITKEEQEKAFSVRAFEKSKEKEKEALKAAKLDEDDDDEEAEATDKAPLSSRKVAPPASPLPPP